MDSNQNRSESLNENLKWNTQEENSNHSPSDLEMLMSNIFRSLPNPNENIFSLTQYLNQISSYIHLLHAYRQKRGPKLDLQNHSNQLNHLNHSNQSKKDDENLNQEDEFPNQKPFPDIGPADQHWIPLVKPFLFYHKFQLARHLYLRDLKDAIQSMDIRQRIVEKQVERLYERVANYFPYRQTPRYAPLYWIFGLSWTSNTSNIPSTPTRTTRISSMNDMDRGFGTSLESGERMDALTIPSIIQHIPMSDSLRQMLTTRPSLQEGTFGQSWGVYSVTTVKPSLINGQEQQWTFYPELDQLMERNFLLRNALHALRDVWFKKYYDLHRGAKSHIRQTIFEEWCFNLLNEREKKVRILIQKLRTGELKEIRRLRSHYISQYNQLVQLNIPHPSKVKF